MKRQVYFLRPIGKRGPIKIGCSAVPNERLEAFLPWSPYPLEIVATLPGDFMLERRLHTRFRRFRIHQEWFRPNPVLLEGLAKLQSGVPVEDAFDLKSLDPSSIIPSRAGGYRPRRSIRREAA